MSQHRRTWLIRSSTALAAAAMGLHPSRSHAQGPAEKEVNQPKQQYRIGVCDWMILKRQKLGAFKRAAEIGADGVEVDMGSLGQRVTFENALADAGRRADFIAEAKKFDLEICSIAMSGFYAQSFAERPTVPRMLRDCLATAQSLGVRDVFLPLGVKGDLVQNPDLRPAVVERLKAVAPAAEMAGAVIGVETSLDAGAEVQLLDEVGSPSIRSYFNFANALQNGRSVCEELETLGAERISQIHCTDEDGVLLENNRRLDMPVVKTTLDTMGWSGWLVMERSRDATDARNVVGNYGANAKFLKSVFQEC